MIDTVYIYIYMYIYIYIYIYIYTHTHTHTLSGSSVVRNLPAKTGATGSIPGSGRSPGEGNSNSLQYSCLGNPMDREVWWATVHGVAKESDMT